jgi:hypothetical protein
MATAKPPALRLERERGIRHDIPKQSGRRQQWELVRRIQFEQYTAGAVGHLVANGRDHAGNDLYRQLLSFEFRQRKQHILGEFGGQTVASLANQSPFQYTMFSQQITVASTTAALTFVGEHGDSGPFELDDVSVVAEGAPAPVTGGGIVSFAVILAGLTARWMRAKRGAGRA